MIAGATLLRQGSFLADERIANLPPLEKPPSDTVILLVEDDPDQMALGELRLTMAGYQVRSVDRAKALSRYLRAAGAPGPAAARRHAAGRQRLRHPRPAARRADFATLPIVLLTVKAELVHIRNGLALGADGYITKPYSKNQLAEVIGRVLKQPASGADQSLRNKTLPPSGRMVGGCAWSRMPPHGPGLSPHRRGKGSPDGARGDENFRRGTARRVPAAARA